MNDKKNINRNLPIIYEDKTVQYKENPIASFPFVKQLALESNNKFTDLENQVNFVIDRYPVLKHLNISQYMTNNN